MCFNASITIPLEVAVTEYHLKILEKFNYSEYSDYKNAFSHPFLPIITKGRLLAKAQWGLIPKWVKDNKKSEEIKKFTLNARVETLTDKPSFKGSVNNGRILVIFDGFFEWQETDGKKEPYYISAKNDKPLIAAGLMSQWGDIFTFTIITTDALGIMKEIHNTKERMPFFISKDDIDLWLDPNIPYTEVISRIKPEFLHLKAEKKQPKAK